MKVFLIRLILFQVTNIFVKVQAKFN